MENKRNTMKGIYKKRERSGTTLQKYKLPNNADKFRVCRKVLHGFPSDVIFNNLQEVEEYVSGDKVCCLLCGKYYKSLGSHIAVHAIDIEDYKKKYNIPRKVPLVGTKTRNKMRDSYTSCGDRCGDHSITSTSRKKMIATFEYEEKLLRDRELQKKNLERYYRGETKRGNRHSILTIEERANERNALFDKFISFIELDYCRNYAALMTGIKNENLAFWFSNFPEMKARYKTAKDLAVSSRLHKDRRDPKIVAEEKAAGMHVDGGTQLLRGRESNRA
jgi:hypothetical protein